MDTIVEARQTPWDQIGDDVSGLMTGDEILAKANLDWTVEKRAALTTDANGGIITVPGQWANVRTSDDKPLGIVGDVHTNVQNADAFAWADSIVADHGAHWERAGSFRDGRVVFAALEIPKHITIPGDDGDIAPFLLISNGHDGKRSLEAAVTAVRVVCQNTLSMALAGAKQRITLRHATNIEERMAVAAEALGITYRYMDALEAAGKTLAAKKVTNAKAEAILRQVFPVPESFDNPDRIDQTDFAKALLVWKNADNLESIRRTGWGVLQAAVEYIDHEVDYRARRWSPGDTRFRQLVIGGVAQTKKQRALTAALAI